MNDGIIVLVTASSEEEARKIATALVDEHLAACVNIAPSIRSFFFWEGKTQDAQESLLICKSRKSLFEKIIKRVKEMHSYSVPEIIALPIVAGSAEYLDWMSKEHDSQK